MVVRNREFPLDSKKNIHHYTKLTLNMFL